MSELIIYERGVNTTAEESHYRAIELIKDFIAKERNSYLSIHADITYEYGGEKYNAIGRVVGMQYGGSLIVSDNPLYQYDSELCFEYMRATPKWWLNPVLEKEFPPGKYIDYIDTYSSLDIINKVFVKTGDIPNSNLKKVLMTGLD